MARWAGVIARATVICLTVAAAGAMAMKTRPDAHPDEGMHLDAFRYFQSHWVRPPLNSDEVLYSGYGWSRVYTGEIVYCIYGRVGGLVQAVYGPLERAYRLYRLLNVGLLAVTLGLLLFAPCQWMGAMWLGLFLACIPQGVYVYTYANSDAWGLSCSLLLFLLTARMLGKPAASWSWRAVAGWMLLVLMVLLSKSNFALGLVLPLLLMGFHLVRCCWRWGRPGWLWWMSRLVLPGMWVVLLAMMWKPSLSPHAGVYAREVEKMREIRADEGHKPSSPAQWGYRKASRGETYEQLLRETPWLESCLKSSYAYFGYWTAEPPSWVYGTAAGLLMGGVALTLLGVAMYRRRVTAELVICVVLGLLLPLANLLGSLYHSLHIDFQPQGRYLLASLVGAFFVFAGTIHLAGPVMRRAHQGLFVLLYALSLYTLVTTGVMNEVLR